MIRRAACVDRSGSAMNIRLVLDGGRGDDYVDNRNSDELIHRGFRHVCADG